jgi:hypothetical protein
MMKKESAPWGSIIADCYRFLKWFYGIFTEVCNNVIELFWRKNECAQTII